MTTSSHRPRSFEQFSRLIDLYPSATPAERAYVERAKQRGWITFQHLPQGNESAKLLDVGSMKGLYGPAYTDLWGYSEVHLLGIEASDGGHIRRSSPDGREYNFPYANCNIELDPWPYPDNTFDTIVCTEVLEHLIFDPMFAVNEMCRVLKPDGVALITVPNAASDSCLSFLANDMQPGFLRNYISDALKSGRRDIDTIYNLGHFHEYTGTELRALAEATGFGIDTLTGFSDTEPLLDSFRFRLLKAFVHLLFPRSARIRGDHLLAVLRKSRFTPLEENTNRYPAPLYQRLPRG